MGVKLPSNSDIIIYNDYGTGANRRTIKHTLPAVWWQEKKAINVIQMGVTSADSVEVLLTKREGYRTPQEWQKLTLDEALNGKHYTLQEGDRMIKGNPADAPLSLQSTQAVDAFFGAQHSHMIMSVDEKILPGGKTHHWNVGLR